MDYATIAAAVGTMTAPQVIQFIIKYAREAGMSSKYAPLLAVGLGIAIGIPAAIGAGFTWYYGLSAGIPLGLVACGGYSAAKLTATDSIDTSA